MKTEQKLGGAPMDSDEKQFLEFGSLGLNENFNRDRLYMEEAEEEDLSDRWKQWKPMKNYEKRWKTMKNNEKQWKTM